jgi:putative acetyltransferase
MSFGDIRLDEAGPADDAALERLYPLAFPHEDLLPLLRRLRAGEAPTLSLVARSGSGVIGHILFTRCAVEESGEQIALLGPLCVDPAHQRRGVGGALIGEGLRRLSESDIAMVCVLGDPAYYGRFGFAKETRIVPPHALPADWAEAWRSRALRAGAMPGGRLAPPPAWRDPALWR